MLNERGSFFEKEKKKKLVEEINKHFYFHFNASVRSSNAENRFHFQRIDHQSSDLSKEEEEEDFIAI